MYAACANTQKHGETLRRWKRENRSKKITESAGLNFGSCRTGTPLVCLLSTLCIVYWKVSSTIIVAMCSAWILPRAKLTAQKAAFAYPWTQYDNNKNPKYQGFDDRDQKQIVSIHTLLERPLGVGPDPLDEIQLRRRLRDKKKDPLIFVADDLHLLDMKVKNSQGVYVYPTTKDNFAELLVQWVRKIFHSLIFIYLSKVATQASIGRGRS